MRKTIFILVLASFLTSTINLPLLRAGEVVVPIMPKPGTMVALSPAFTPAHLQGIVIHPDNALQFDFLIHKGDSNLSVVQKMEEYNKLIKYFLASLTVPDADQWVNLSPYEHNRIIKDNFGQTEMGRDLLGQDYLLKQITSSLMYPESGLGKSFWNKVYEKAYKELGNTNIPVNTFNKVWIVPSEAVIHENGNTAFIVKSHLKVMLEEDYTSLEKHTATNTPRNQTHALSSKAIKDIILPALEQEVNEGKNFAQLRQVFSGMILATWYKQALKESILGKVYADKAKIKGVDQNPKNNEQIYQQYLQAFKKGVYNYIKEDEDKFTNQPIPRKYFAGGVGAHDATLVSKAMVTPQVLKQDFAMAGPGLEAVSAVIRPENKANLAMNAQGKKAAEVFGLDEKAVLDLTAKNAETNYGSTVVMGHPFSGEGQSRIEQWNQEIKQITGGAFHLNTRFIHATVGAILRSQSEPIVEKDLQGIDVEGIRGVLRKAKPFSIRFTEILLSAGKEGNLVLKGEVPPEANLSEIKRQMAEKGANLKWSAPSDLTKPTAVFVTLGHINKDALNGMTESQAREFRNWVDAHKLIEPFEVQVNSFKIVTYDQRELKSTVKSDEEIHLTGGLEDEMRVRFDRLKQIPVKAAIYDFDMNLSAGRRFTLDAMQIILAQRRLGIPVVIISGRAYDPNSETRQAGSVGIKDALVEFNQFLDSVHIATQEKDEILKGLYIGSENGGTLSNGFIRGEEGYQSLDRWLAKKLGVDFNSAEQQARTSRLINFLNSIGSPSIKRKVIKERSYTIFADRQNLVAIKQAVIDQLRTAGLLDQYLRFSVTENTVEVSFFPVDKSIGLDFLEDELGIKDDAEGIVISSGDNGHRDGNDYQLLDRIGGLSSDLHDIESHMIALSLISGVKSGTESNIWALKQLKYRASSGESVSLSIINNAAMALVLSMALP